jgi:hypothetical protein
MPVPVSFLHLLESQTPIDTFTYTGIPISLGSANWSDQVLGGSHNPLQATGAAVMATNPDTDNSGWRNDQNWGPNLAMMLTMTTKGSAGNGSIGLYFGLQGAGLGTGTPNGYRGECRIRSGSTDEFRIQRCDVGVDTQILTATIDPSTLQELIATESLAVIRVGVQIEVWGKFGSGVGWNFKGSIGDATYMAAGKVGILINDSTTADSVYDSLRVMDIPATYGRRVSYLQMPQKPPWQQRYTIGSLEDLTV